MKVKGLNNIIHIVSDKFKKNHSTYQDLNEYVFNTQDLDELKRDNIEKIKELKKDIIDTTHKKEEPLDEGVLNDAIFNNNDKTIDLNNEINDDIIDSQDDFVEEVDNSEDDVLVEKKKSSFVYLEQEHQDLIMKKWKEIDLIDIERDILDGKDLLNHNYTITYADDAARFIHIIRKKYEVVLCYLIGFNNEKKGVYDKTYFSDNVDDDWKYLSYYIKLLEKIKNFKIS